MKIRPKIPKFQNGGVPQWYLNRYGNRTSLLGWNSNLRYNYANLNLNANDHRNAGNLDTVYRKNMAYIGTPGAVSSDILSFYNSDANGMSALEFVDFYNKNAEDIRKHWALNLTYGKDSAGSHNRLFRRMFQSRSNLQESPGSDYNIGYLLGRTKGGYDIQDIEGSSTWLRRMDLYENEFDLNNPDSNRLHEITLKDGTKAIVYKKANGDIGLYNPNQQESLKNNPPSLTVDGGNPLPANTPEVVVTGNQQTGKSTEIGAGEGKKLIPPTNNLANLSERLRGIIPGLLATGRLAGNLINNARVYDEALKGIRPTLLQPYETHRLIVGDEATKLAYYRRAAAGLTRAAQPFTSDADRLMAYMLEARRIGDELRALGDLADNAEIRRTSDESNQHEWANTLRRTEVANTNLASLNDTNEKKHTLLALKHSAQWSSIDNYLKELETRKRLLLEEDRAYANLINLLDALNEYENDEEYLKAFENLKKLGKINPTTGIREYDTTDPNVIAAREALRNADLNRTKRMWLNIRNFRRNYQTLFVKSGSKITYKKDDKLLYKSTKDVVDHFRRMCRRYPEKERKIQKLAPHPNGKRRKYQVGGQFLAPFTVYTPAVGIGETAKTVSLDSTGVSSSRGSSNKDTSSKDVLDLIKMFKDLKGVKVDVSSIYSTLNGVLQEAEIFGKELNSLLIASMYLRAMLQLNNVSRSKEIYDKAYELAAANGALNEIAVNSIGQYAVLNRETGKIETVSKIDPSKHIALTNSQLLTFREFSPDLAFGKGDEMMQNVVANGVGLPKIGLEIKNLAGLLGSSELKLDGVSEVESNQVKLGLKLLQGAPDGQYKTTTETKNLLVLKLAAINYIINMLPANYLAVLEARGGARNLIPTFLSSLMDDSLTISFTPMTGKAASNGDSSNGSKGGLEMNNALKLLTGAGEEHLETFGIGNNNVILAAARQSIIADTSDSEKPFGADFSYNKLYESGVGRILDLDNASFGDVPINKTMKDSIIVDNSRIVSVDLPYTTSRDGRIIPDFQLLNRILEADREVLRQNLNPNKESDINKINLIYADKKLPIKYNSVNQLTGNYKKFAVILATAVEDAFLNKDGLATNGTLTLVTDDNEKDKYVRLMAEITKDKKYSLTKPGIFNWGDKDVYKGSIFIPINGDITDASMAGGASKVKTGMSDDYDTMRKVWNARNYLEVPQVNFSK